MWQCSGQEDLAPGSGISGTWAGQRGAYRAGGEALLPLRHAEALLQAGALVHHDVPATVRVLGPDAGAGNTRQRVKRGSFNHE